jgi:hypothetical protein
MLQTSAIVHHPGQGHVVEELGAVVNGHDHDFSLFRFHVLMKSVTFIALWIIGAQGN